MQNIKSSCEEKNLKDSTNYFFCKRDIELIKKYENFSGRQIVFSKNKNTKPQKFRFKQEELEEELKNQTYLKDFEVEHLLGSEYQIYHKNYSLANDNEPFLTFFLDYNNYMGIQLYIGDKTVYIVDVELSSFHPSAIAEAIKREANYYIPPKDQFEDYVKEIKESENETEIKKTTLIQKNPEIKLGFFQNLLLVLFGNSLSKDEIVKVISFSFPNTTKIVIGSKNKKFRYSKKLNFLVYFIALSTSGEEIAGEVFSYKQDLVVRIGEEYKCIQKRDLKKVLSGDFLFMEKYNKYLDYELGDISLGSVELQELMNSSLDAQSGLRYNQESTTQVGTGVRGESLENEVINSTRLMLRR